MYIINIYIYIYIYIFIYLFIYLFFLRKKVKGCRRKKRCHCYSEDEGETINKVRYPKELESDMATMILHSSLLSLTSAAKITSLSIAVVRSDSSPSRPSSPVAVPYQSLTPSLLCSCGRRHLIQACATALLPISPSHATPLLSDSTVLLHNCYFLFFSFLLSLTPLLSPNQITKSLISITASLIC